MIPTELLRLTHERLKMEDGHAPRRWTDGPLADLADTLARLPGVTVHHVVHGEATEKGVTTPRLLLAIADPQVAMLIARSIQRPGTYAGTRLEWIVRPVGDGEHPWLEAVRELETPDDWGETLWWVHPLGQPHDVAAQRAWLAEAHEDYETGELFAAHLGIFLEGKLAERDEQARLAARRR